MSVEKYLKIKRNNIRSNGIDSVDNYISDEKKTSENIGSNIDKLSDYTDRIEKTYFQEEKKKLISGVNCTAKSFAKISHSLEKKYHKNKTERLNKGHRANDVFHFISSYKGHNVNPEIIHRAGIELCEELCKDEFIGKVSTHLDTDNTHNHIIICAYALDSQHKFVDEYHLYKKVRELANEISLRHGLSIIEDDFRERKNKYEVLEGQTKKKLPDILSKELKENIKKSILSSSTIADFKKNMEGMGYHVEDQELRGELHFFYEKENWKCSDIRLGKKYTRAGIEQMLEENTLIREKKNLLDKQNSEAETYYHTIDLSGIYVPKYDIYGRRIPAILQLLQLIKQVLERVGDSFIDTTAEEHIVKNTALISSDQKIKLVSEALFFAEHYGIRSEKGLLKRQKDVKNKIFLLDVELKKTVDTIKQMKNLLRKEEELKHLSGELDKFKINKYRFSRRELSDEEIKRNIAKLNPISVYQKKKILQKLFKSGIRIQSEKLNQLDRKEAKQLLSYLTGQSTVCPNVLISREEYEKEKKKRLFQLRAEEYFERLRKKQHDLPATRKQLYALQGLLSEEMQKNISLMTLRKDDAGRILNTLLDSPIREDSFKSKESIKVLSNWEKNTLHLIQSLYPKELEINIREINKKEANNIIQYFFGKVDHIFADLQEEKVQKNESLSCRDLIKHENNTLKKGEESYSEEQEKVILQYKAIFQTLIEYGLDKEEYRKNFSKTLEELSLEVQKLNEEKKSLEKEEKELKKIDSAVRYMDNRAFIFGNLYRGETESYQSIVKNIDSPSLDYLLEIEESIPPIIKELEQCDEYYSLPVSSLQVIDELKNILPEEFQPGLKNRTNKELIRILSSERFKQSLSEIIRKESGKQEKQRLEENLEWYPIHKSSSFKQSRGR